MSETLALSLRQPWLWAITHCALPKRIENRTRAIFRDWQGRSLWLHAAKGDTREDWAAFNEFVDARFPALGIPDRSDVARGGIVARVDIIGLITPEGQSLPGSAEGVDVRWHIPGQWGYMLGSVTLTPFVAMRGQQGLWRLTPQELQRAAGA